MYKGVTDMKPTARFILCLGIIPFLIPNYLQAQYQILASVLGSGGGVVSATTFRDSSTVGQTFAGTLEAGTFRMHVGFWRITRRLTPVEHLAECFPLHYRLDQNYPNPFNPSTNIRFAVKKRSHVSLIVLSLLGQSVATLVDEELPPGEYQACFSPTGFASGLYFYRLVAGPFVETKKMLLLR
jgi:hypothetical protein